MCMVDELFVMEVENGEFVELELGNKFEIFGVFFEFIDLIYFQCDIYLWMVLVSYLWVNVFFFGFFNFFFI